MSFTLCRALDCIIWSDLLRSEAIFLSATDDLLKFSNSWKWPLSPFFFLPHLNCANFYPMVMRKMGRKRKKATTVRNHHQMIVTMKKAIVMVYGLAALFWSWGKHLERARVESSLSTSFHDNPLTMAPRASENRSNYASTCLILPQISQFGYSKIHVGCCQDP